MRGQVRPRHQGRGRRHWPSRALCCRLVPQQRTYQAHRPRAQRPQGRCHRRRPVRPDRRRRSGQAGLQGHRLRSPARCGWRVDVRHPRVPSAQGHRPARGRGPEGAGCGHRDEHGHRQGADHRRADEPHRGAGRRERLGQGYDLRGDGAGRAGCVRTPPPHRQGGQRVRSER